jgi:hypothetical protein
VFWRFSSKILSNKTYFVDSSFPTFALSFSRSNNFEHLCLCHWLDFLYRDWPLSRFLLSLLLDHIRQYFWVSLLLSIHEICWDCSILNILNSAFCVLFLMLFNRLLHLNLFFKSFLIEKFGFDTLQCLSLLWYNFGLSCLFLSSLLLSI